MICIITSHCVTLTQFKHFFMVIFLYSTIFKVPLCLEFAKSYS